MKTSEVLPMRVGILTLGCDKNTVDNEYLAGLLSAAGCTVHSLLLDATAPELDVVVATTCGFIGDAKRQSVEHLVALAEQKRATGFPRRIIAAGCLAQRYARDLLREIPEIDIAAGVGQIEALAAWILGENYDEQRNRTAPQPSVVMRRSLPRMPLESAPYAYLRIADGCNHQCAFCAIPKMKGPLHSVPPEILLDEARGLLARGAREINLIAQDIAVYGTDLGNNYRLPQLLRDLCRIPGDFWVRCLYCYPGGVNDALLETMVSEPKITPYLDMPLQHMDPEILRRMRRPFHDLDIPQLVMRIRAAIPGIVLRTTMLVGFPGESAQAHRRMLDGMRALAFERLGAFPFSKEEGTAAALFPRQLRQATILKRWHAVMQTQAFIAERFQQRRIGAKVRVLIEGYDAERRAWRARSAAEAPEIDGSIYIHSDTALSVGAFFTV
ncbi:MAG TPA: 30S ribosomal protein S12 methylthiotransferase RimO, partial [Candidatus Hydrogenedentes bacterium]|nr:30S ribosomal protein S12 methylthiotransferase RimO [Candidatus Hydrogenedentota bacterium]